MDIGFLLMRRSPSLVTVNHTQNLQRTSLSRDTSDGLPRPLDDPGFEPSPPPSPLPSIIQC